MRIEVRAVGRMKSGPERDLFDEYLKRAQGQGRALGFTAIEEREIDPRGKADKRAETASLIQDLPVGAQIVALDERGKDLTSREIAGKIESWRDQGIRDLVFLIGGADGLDRDQLSPSTHYIAFGRATWPHKMVRAMIGEQIYRSIALMAGAPYHRD
ncbi:23S rRNA (pseudouridine(1915)-N(3))-methyltransferase RlmH [Woodsholea maritima]|uniref:23S rRNA (pseudouridine(1915)-N(3))-methyltransferase RlmH n=1 Tax=Woodsholea maritima TaxID=240237 RepID=UPI0003A7F8B7|nr:23S rRNA (pseudouridine(1915)-N(3))-methyltransferase RlmH [Woodsholea maritima]